MHLLYPFAKRFIAGEDLPSALKSIKTLNKTGFLSTIDILGEDVFSVRQAEAEKNAYLDLWREISSSPYPMDVSVKLTQVGLEIDRSLCEKHLMEILTAAGSNTIRFDMEGSPHTQDTLEMCHKLHKDHQNLGQAVQAYLFRTEKDVDTLIEKGISVRLCKGAYKEPATIAYQSMDDIRENFKKLAFKLLKEGYQPAIATHDEHLLIGIKDFIEKEKVDPHSFYFEMLYGMGRDLQKILLDKGYQVRVYVPFGKSWLPYTLRRLAEKKENILFVLTHLFRETFGIRKLK